MSDVEARFLLYTIAFGAAFGLGSLLRRKALSFWFHLVVLALLLAASISGLIWQERLAPVVEALFAAFCVLALLPSVLLLTARRLAVARRHSWASPLTTIAGLLLGLPVPIRREASFYAAMAAAERGDEHSCARGLEGLARLQALPQVTGGAALARVLPPAAMRRWPEVLALLDAQPAAGTAIRALEARAAAETGDFARALDACRVLAAAGPHARGMLGQARRAVLACAGRAAFLEEAERRGLPVVQGPRGVASLTLARAYEAAGRIEDARGRYADTARRLHGRARADATEGLARCDRGEPRRAAPTGDHEDALAALERECAAEIASGAARVPGSARVILALCVVTLLGTLAQWGLEGTSELGPEFVGALAAGALSAPLVLGEGEWWRLGATMLLHVGWVHLLMNLGSILIVGIPLERRIGGARTVLVYIASGWAASLASVVLAGTPLGVGASGAAMGVFGAFFVLLLRQPRTFGFAERARWLRVVWITIAATAAVGWLESRYVDNAAHGIGFVAGALVAFPMLRRGAPLSPRPGSVVRLAAALLVVLQIVAVALTAKAAGGWLGLHEVSGAGVSANLASQSYTEETEGGLLIRRPPGPTWLQFGVEGEHLPDPETLVLRAADDEFAPPGLVRAFRAGPVSEGEASVPTPDGAARIERRTYAFAVPDWERGRFHLVTIRRAGAFAVVFVPPERGAEELHEPMVEELTRSLRRTALPE